MNPLSVVLWCAGILLQGILLQLLFVRGLFRRYQLLTLYCAVLFCTTVIDLSLYLDFGGWSKRGKIVYWIDDSLRQFFFFILLISLTFQVLAVTRRVDTRRAVILIVALLVALISVFAYRNPDQITLWLTPVMRNISFVAVLINIIFWFTLVRDRSASQVLFLLSCGIGIQMAGEAMGQSIRLIGFELGGNAVLARIGNLVMVFSHYLCLIVWRQALLRSLSKASVQQESGGECTSSGR